MKLYGVLNFLVFVALVAKPLFWERRISASVVVGTVWNHSFLSGGICCLFRPPQGTEYYTVPLDETNLVSEDGFKLQVYIIQALSISTH